MFLPEPTESRTREAVPEIDSRLDALKRDLDTLLRKYTDQHPDVVATQRLIGQLEEQRNAELDARKKAAASQPQRVRRRSTRIRCSSR